jgi:hypothetical protein
MLNLKKIKIEKELMAKKYHYRILDLGCFKEKTPFVLRYSCTEVLYLYVEDYHIKRKRMFTKAADLEVPVVR